MSSRDVVVGIVSSATPRTFHQGRPSCTSYARFSASIIATTALEEAQSATRIPKESTPPFLIRHQLPNMVLQKGDHVAGEQPGERGQKALHQVGNWKIAQQCRQKEHKRKDRKQKVIGQLRRPAQA